MRNDSECLLSYKQRYQTIWAGEEDFQRKIQYAHVCLCICVYYVQHACVSFTVVFKYLTVCTCMNVCGCLSMWHRAKRMTQSRSSRCVCVCATVREALWRTSSEHWRNALAGPLCGTWPPLCSVSSTLRGSTIPQPPAHNTHHSIPQTTTEQNTTTPGTISTQSFARRKKNTWTKTNKTLWTQQHSQTTS